MTAGKDDVEQKSDENGEDKDERDTTNSSLPVGGHLVTSEKEKERVFSYLVLVLRYLGRRDKTIASAIYFNISNIFQHQQSK